MKLSIVTVHLNDFSGLQATLESLRRLKKSNSVEWIVVDGGSEVLDGGIAIIEKVRNFSGHFVSEPDQGIYDAMNKGTRLVSGEYVLFLNAGDELHPEFRFDKVADALAVGNAGMIWGWADVRDRTGNVYPRKTRKPFWLRYGMAVSHQAILFRRELLGDDPYDTDLNIAADYDLICRLYKSAHGIKRIDAPVCIFDLVGKSSQNRRGTLQEESRIRRKHFGFSVVTDRIIMEFKGVVWGLGTILPTFRRVWSKFF